MAEGGTQRPPRHNEESVPGGVSPRRWCPTDPFVGYLRSTKDMSKPVHEKSHASFPPTRPSIVVAASDGDPNVRRAAFERVASAYLAPIYAYLRLRHGKSREDSEDLLQNVFATLFERDSLATFDPTKARFRTFLRVCVDRLVLNANAADRAEKRGGGGIRIDIADLESRLGERAIERASREPIADAAEGEVFFLREWRRALFTSAIGEVREDCERRGRTMRFSLFRRLDIEASDPRPSYAELAKEHGVDVTTVTNELAAARREFRRAILDRLREQTTDESEFREELDALLGGSL